MIRQIALPRLGPWLVGLFFIAQICGVVQLLGEHTEHVAESQLIFTRRPLLETLRMAIITTMVMRMAPFSTTNCRT